MTDASMSHRLSLPCDITPYLPHRYGMCLLDTLLEVGDEHLHAATTPRQDSLFACADGIPGWVGLEWLAQAVAAWAGVQAVAKGGTPRIGFLLGTRRYQCQTQHFAFDQPIRIEVELDFRADNGLGAFRGRLLNKRNEPLGFATINVFQPESETALEAMQERSGL